MKTRARVLDSKIYANLYDIYMKLWWFGRDNKFKNKILSFVNIKTTHSVLDVGCGTGALTRIVAKKARYVVGVDAATAMVEVAKRKTKNLSNLEFKQAIAEELPFDTDSFDIVLSTMTLHHLPTCDKTKAIKEMHRVLKPRGQFLLVDFGKSTCLKGRFIKIVWSYEPYIRDNFEGRLLELVKTAGFRKAWQDKGCGIITYIKAVK